MFRLAFALIAFVNAAQAQCVGDNLIDALPETERAALFEAAHAAPFATGNLWQATRGAETLTLTGTFHLDDPRHDAYVATLLPLLATAKTLLVEAGPEQEKALQQKLTADPSAMFTLQGSGLKEALAPAEWDALAAALLQRAIPSSLAEKLRPWFISMMLSIPPCALQTAADGAGLDRRLMAAAQAQGIRIAALEPFDTVLRLFDGLTMGEQLTMIRNALQMEQQAADFLATTSDAFFAGESRLVWEFTRKMAHDIPGSTAAQVDADFAKAEEALMSARNRAWIDMIETALQDGPAFAAFGALHLSGDEGVLALLQERGFTVTRLPN